MMRFGDRRSYCVLQKDPGFDRGQFHKQVSVMRGQVGLLLYRPKFESVQIATTGNSPAVHQTKSFLSLDLESDPSPEGR